MSPLRQDPHLSESKTAITSILNPSEDDLTLTKKLSPIHHAESVASLQNKTLESGLPPLFDPIPAVQESQMSLNQELPSLQAAVADSAVGHSAGVKRPADEEDEDYGDI